MTLSSVYEKIMIIEKQAPKKSISFKSMSMWRSERATEIQEEFTKVIKEGFTEKEIFNLGPED